jgi:hypothetical protein
MGAGAPKRRSKRGLTRDANVWRGHLGKRIDVGVAPLNYVTIGTVVIREVQDGRIRTPTNLAGRRKADHALDCTTAEAVESLIVVAYDSDVVGLLVRKAQIDGFLNWVCVLVFVHK